MRTIITVISLLCSTYLMAQTNYYTATKTFNENTYTYQCDVDESKWVTLYNKNNKFTYLYSKYKATEEHYFPPSGKWVRLWEKDTWTANKRESIVANALSASEKQRVKGRGVTINMYINSQTGKIDEVNFEFHGTNPYATIPLSVYRKIETELKSQVWYTPTAEGRKLNFILRNWRYKVP